MPRVALDGDISTYRISDMDSSGAVQYYGYVDKFGNWFIMKLTDTEVRYVRGSGNYDVAWTNRNSLSYDYFDRVF